MCLYNITKENPPPFGYAIVRKVEEGKYKPMVFAGLGVSRLGKWNKATPSRVATPHGPDYYSGFHMFNRQRDAINYLLDMTSEDERERRDFALVKCVWKDCIVTGTQDYVYINRSEDAFWAEAPAFVVKHRKIIKEIRSW